MTQIQYGPDNPHPFSRIRTELIWEGKYDEYSNHREVDIAGTFGGMDGVGVVFGGEVGKLQHVKAEVVGIEAGRAVFGIDHGDFAIVGQSCGYNESG